MLDKVADKALFDPEKFDRELAGPGPAVLGLFKQALKTGNRFLAGEFERGEDIHRLLQDRAWLIDQLLVRAWRLKAGTGELSLTAVGGYGRGELYPASDIDLMIILPPRVKPEVKSGSLGRSRA